MSDNSISLADRLSADMKVAMKAGDKARLGVIRMVLSEVKNADLHKSTPEKMAEGYAKKLRKAADEMRKVGQNAEAEKIEAELAVVAAYLPAKLDEQTTAQLVEAFFETHTNFTSADIGRATGMFMKQHGDAIDPGIAGNLIRQKLSPAEQ